MLRAEGGEAECPAGTGESMGTLCPAGAPCPAGFAPDPVLPLPRRRLQRPKTRFNISRALIYLAVQEDFIKHHTASAEAYLTIQYNKTTASYITKQRKVPWGGPPRSG